MPVVFSREVRDNRPRRLPNRGRVSFDIISVYCSVAAVIADFRSHAKQRLRTQRHLRDHYETYPVCAENGAD